MRKILLLTSVISLVILMSSCCCGGSSCNSEQLVVSDMVVGNTYLYSRDWSDPNPYDGGIDTVLILGISGDYIQWVNVEYARMDLYTENDIIDLSKNGDMFYILQRFRRIPGDSVIEEILDESLEYNSEVLYDIN